MTPSPIIPIPVAQAPPQNSKRIKSVRLKNYRAYIDDYDPILLPKGQNLLIYGENGSGKTSLFKAINNYLSSSVDRRLPFVKHRHNQNNEGEVSISFSDFDPQFQEIPGTDQTFNFSSQNSTNNVPFIQSAALIKGFLDYTDLLQVYFHKDPNPNLFSLIVLTLLGEHIPNTTGGTFKFKDRWDNLQKRLIELSYTRKARIHQTAIAELPVYRTHLTASLNRVFTELNRLLRVYFPELNIELAYTLKPFKFNYGAKWKWYTTSELYLNIKKDGVLISGGYNDILNEARLSAFAICLYLASLKNNPSSVSLKILYLDDIFIGLDGSNRIPILKILQKEFSEYQIFVSSYDRYTFEVAKRHFEVNSPDSWLSIEFYVAKGKIGNITFDKPLVVQDDNSFSKAVYYLHHPIKPDYPASANYFRKFAEETLLNYLPTHEIRNEDYSLIDNYKLGYLVACGLHFFNKINTDNKLLLELKNLLPTILHPLSHFNLSSPIYKNELMDAQNCLFDLERYLRLLQPTYRTFIPQSKMLKLRITLGIDSFGYYEVHAKEMIYLINNAGTPILSNGGWHARCSYTITNGNKSLEQRYSLGNAHFNYTSLEDAYNKIFAFLSPLPEYAAIIRSTNYATEFEMNYNGVWQSLSSLLVFSV